MILSDPFHNPQPLPNFGFLQKKNTNFLHFWGLLRRYVNPPLPWSDLVNDLCYVIFILPIWFGFNMAIKKAPGQRNCQLTIDKTYKHNEVVNHFHSCTIVGSPYGIVSPRRKRLEGVEVVRRPLPTSTPLPVAGGVAGGGCGLLLHLPGRRRIPRPTHPTSQPPMPHSLEAPTRFNQQLKLQKP